MTADARRSLLAARSLRKSFGPLAVLRGVDLDIAPGEAVAILGPNGAGKSTLLRLLAGISRASGGSLRLLDADFYPGRPAPEVLGRIGFLGHDPLVYRDLTGRQNLEFFARIYARGRGGDGNGAASLARAGLERVGLGEVADRPAHALSRGLLQRLAIARATLNSPELLLLDEPFTGLDPTASTLLEGFLLEHRARGRTVVLVTHDLERVPRLASRAIVLHRGRVRLDLSPVPQALELAGGYRDVTGRVTPSADDVGDHS